LQQCAAQHAVATRCGNAVQDCDFLALSFVRDADTVVRVKEMVR
jgi:hypothetical protein